MSTATEETVAAEKHMLSIPDHTGDSRIMWDPRVPEEVEMAKAAFEKAKNSGMAAFRVGTDGESTGEIVREFDPNMTKVIMVKQLAGG